MIKVPTEEAKKSRLFELSILNVALCLIVVFIHVSAKPVTELDKNTWQYVAVLVPWRLSAFVVQGFVFLSGLRLFLGKSVDRPHHKFLGNRLMHIFLPYIVWVIVYYIYFCLKGYLTPRITDLLRYIAFGDLVSPFYFIVIIAQFYILLPLWKKLIKKTNPVVLVVLSTVLTILFRQNLPDILSDLIPGFTFRYNDRVFTSYLIYWILGCYAGANYEAFKKVLSDNRLIITVFFCIAALGNAFLSLLSFSGMKYISWLENVHLLYCVSAVAFFSMSAVLLAGKIQHASGARLAGSIKKVDRISYGVYLSHSLVIFITDGILTRINITSIGISYLIRFCAVYTLTIGLLMLWRVFRDFIGARIGPRISR